MPCNTCIPRQKQRNAAYRIFLRRILRNVGGINPARQGGTVVLERRFKAVLHSQPLQTAEVILRRLRIADIQKTPEQVQDVRDACERALFLVGVSVRYNTSQTPPFTFVWRNGHLEHPDLSDILSHLAATNIHKL